MYNANDDLEIHSKIVVLAEHFGLKLGEIACHPDDCEEFILQFTLSKAVSVECIHVLSETFKTRDCSDFTKVMGNNFYYFRRL